MIIFTGREHSKHASGTCLELHIFDSIAHGHREGPALHEELDSSVELVREISRQHFAFWCGVLLQSVSIAG